MEFLQSTYEAAANLGHWDRAALECALGEVGRLSGGLVLSRAGPQVRGVDVAVDGISGIGKSASNFTPA